MTETIDHQRVIWHSRRGMLELDLVLEPFVKQQYPSLSPQQQSDYRHLLESQDQDLYDWFLQKKVPDTLRLQSIVQMVLDYQRSRDLSQLIE